ncbi:MAG: MarR family winged helix-turn-helix transcriptional regulator [Steroidobacteraceae bacterium]
MAAGKSGLDLGDLPDLLGYNIRRAQVVLWRDFLRSVDAGSGIRPGVFSLLLLVARNPGAAQIELARELAIDKASIVMVVHRLEKAKLVERRRSTVDRRRQGLFLTPTGTKKVAAMRTRMRRHEQRYLGRMSAAEGRTLIRLLKRLYADPDHPDAK